MSDKQKESVWIAIISGLAKSGELSPERLGELGGDARVRTLSTHAAYLAANFHAEFVRVNSGIPQEVKAEVSGE